MGDTSNSDMIIPLAMDADIVIHEATNAWIKDQVKKGTRDIID